MKKIFLLFLLSAFFNSINVSAQTCKAGVIKARFDSICLFISDNDSFFSPKTDTLFVKGSIDSIQWQTADTTGVFHDILNANDSMYINSSYSNTIFRVIVHNANLCYDTSSTYSLKILATQGYSYHYIYNGNCVFNFYPDSGSITPDSYYWDFGDGDTSTLRYPQHSYHKDTSFFVCISTLFYNRCSWTFCRPLDLTFFNCPKLIGVENILGRNQWTVYPTVTNDVLNFENTGNHLGYLQLIDVLGRIQYQTNYLAYSNLQISTVHLPKGIYLLRVAEGNEIYTQRVILQ